MKRFISLSILVALITLFSSCIGGYFVTNYLTTYSPVYMTIEDLENSFELVSDRAPENSGKIVLYDQYLLVNERNSGFFIIDISIPAEPEILTFVNIPGNYDMAVRDGYVYADSFMDIVVIDISNLPDIESVKLISRMKDKLIYDPLRNIGPLEHDNHAGIFSRVDEIDNSQGVVVSWNSKTTSSKQWVPWGAQFSSPGVISVGITGSMSRFSIANNFLYIIDNKNLYTFGFNETPVPILNNMQETPIGDFIIETIFNYGDFLYIGSETGIFLYSILEPDNPSLVSTYVHITSRDPVIVDGDIAYSTLLWDGLSIIDFSDKENPILVSNINLLYPKGLSLDKPFLFVTDDRGFRVYNVSDPANLVQVNFIQQDYYTKLYDVITFNGLAFFTSTNSILIYDYSDIENIKLISTIISPQAELEF